VKVRFTMHVVLSHIIFTVLSLHVKIVEEPFWHICTYFLLVWKSYDVLQSLLDLNLGLEWFINFQTMQCKT